MVTDLILAERLTNRLPLRREANSHILGLVANPKGNIPFLSRSCGDTWGALKFLDSRSSKAGSNLPQVLHI